MSTLQELNALRKQLGISPLKKWSESKAALAARVEKLQERVTALSANSHKAAEKVDTKAAAKKVTPPDDGVKLASICRDMKINPRAARIKLREAYKGKGMPETLGGAWMWSPGDVVKVKEVLSGEDKKN